MSAAALPSPRLVPALVESDDPLVSLTEKQRLTASAKYQVLKAVERLAKEAGSFNAALDNLYAHAVRDDTSAFALLLKRAPKQKKSQFPSKGNIYKWRDRFADGGLAALAPGYKGSKPDEYEWHAAALRYYRMPTKPTMAAVAKKLRRDGHASAKEDRVARFLKRQSPDTINRGRMGPRAYRDAHLSYTRRQPPKPGEVYQGDGHTVDIRLQHPTGKRPFRPELTLWLDVGARYVTGFWVSHAESASSTIFAIANALDSADHIPKAVHVDNGSGYKNHILSDKALGVYSRLGISVCHSLPYNAKAKGHVERWFGTMERQCNVFLPGYCGGDTDDEYAKALMRKHEQGEGVLLTLNEWLAEFVSYIEAYHNEPHEGLDGRTPAEVWAERERCAPQPHMALDLLPSKQCTVSRETIRLHKREYSHPSLRHYNGSKLRVSWTMHTDKKVRVCKLDGTWICDANLIKKAAYLPESFMAQATQTRAAQAIKRKQKAIEEDKRRAGLAITQQDTLDSVAQVLGQPAEPTPIDHQPDEPIDTFDLLGEALAESATANTTSGGE